MTGLALVVALVCFGVSIRIAPQTPSGRRVDAAGALAPALFALGPAGYGLTTTAGVLVPAIVVLCVTEALRRGRPVLLAPVLLATAGRSILVASSAATLAGISALAGTPLAEGGRALVLAGVTVAAAVFPIGAWMGRGIWLRRRGRPAAELLDEIRASAPLHVVFLSTAGLVAVSYGELGWLAFVVLLLPLAATAMAFSRYAAARATYSQTVRALGALTETAGYVRPGHHERVAGLCVRMARELGLPGDRVHRIELTALLHDVGTVSVAEPGDLATIDPTLVARAGARVLEETGYLARQARLVAAQAVSAHEATSIDARILRVASAYDDLGDPSPAALATFGRCVAPEDMRAYEALHRIVSGPGALELA